MRRLDLVAAIILILGCGTVVADDHCAPRPETVERVWASRGDVTIRRVGINDVQIMVDTADGPKDGLIDQWFTVQSEETFAGADWTHLTDAEVQYRKGALRIVAHEQHVAYDFAIPRFERFPALPPSYIVQELNAYGIARAKAPASVPLPKARPSDVAALDQTGSDTADCDSGGPGSTSAAVTSGSKSCETSCSAGYYACCQIISTGVNCRCVRN